MSKLRLAAQKKGVMMIIITKGTCNSSIHDNLESLMAFGRDVLFFSHIFGIFNINIVEKLSMV